MKRYTVDANALVDFSLGILPDAAHRAARRKPTALAVGGIRR
jgi:hypothetical protein